MTVPDEANLATEENAITPTIVANFAVSSDGIDIHWVWWFGFGSFNKTSVSTISGLTLISSSGKYFSSLVTVDASNSQAYIHRKKLTPMAHKETQKFWIARNVLAAIRKEMKYHKNDESKVFEKLNWIY